MRAPLSQKKTMVGLDPAYFGPLHFSPRWGEDATVAGDAPVDPTEVILGRRTGVESSAQHTLEVEVYSWRSEVGAGTEHYRVFYRTDPNTTNKTNLLQPAGPPARRRCRQSRRQLKCHDGLADHGAVGNGLEGLPHIGNVKAVRDLKYIGWRAPVSPR